MLRVGAITVIATFNLMILKNRMPSGGLMIYFLWVVIFLKEYATEGTICKLAGVDDPKTLRKWIWPFICALSYFESEMARASRK